MALGEELMPRALDLAGLTFGRLTVLSRDGKNDHGDFLWKCQCTCGEQASVMATQLARGHTRSCGCLRGTGKLKDTTVRIQEMRRSGVSPPDIRRALGVTRNVVAGALFRSKKVENRESSAS